MARTWHEAALKREVGEFREREIHASAELGSIAYDMRYLTGDDALLRDAIVQKTVDSYNEHDAYVWVAVTDMIEQGELAMACLVIADEPRPDADVAGNNALLKTLREPFTGNFIGEKRIQDGVIRWTAPAIFFLKTAGGNAALQMVPSQLPLEVGTTAASRTIAHMRQEWGVARWPYGHKKLILLHRLPFYPAKD